jgi:signal transduction histidine kinase
VEGRVSGIAARCLNAVLGALALQGCAFMLVSLALGLSVDAAFVLRLAFVLPVAALVTNVLLGPLRADLQDLEQLTARATAAQAGVASLPARTAEVAPLLESVALLASRAGELETTAADARSAVLEAERLRTSFVAAMAHDLRAPLNAIIGFSDLLVMEKHDAVAPAQRPSVEIIRRSAQDLLVLLDQILDWAKLEAGLIELHKAPTALASVLHEAAEEAERRSADRGLTVALDLPSDLPAANVDALRVKQALLGLLDHATRAPDEPRVTLSARVRASESGGACVRVELRDPQLSVRQADQPAFFEAFRPSYAPTGRRVAGLGLGPALARALVRAHGGSVWFASGADGTTFTLELPIDGAV